MPLALLPVGAFGIATVPPLRKRVLDHAHGAPAPASAAGIGAFGLGDALAARLGGAVIAAGTGWTAPNRVGAPLAAAAPGLAFRPAAPKRRTPADAPAADTVPAPVPVHG
ncbi:hypothetical protein ACFCV8_23640 [Streptomyces sp. NPDC056347]|uniref:hypothetical protein n=1 Tax=Streptomyces sp. NPDC056347 TaxID=3345790 RepID=UPI0035DFAFAF